MLISLSPYCFSMISSLMAESFSFAKYVMKDMASLSM